jgi:pimeloyl-ACP methyl ester carboxylesterase
MTPAWFSKAIAHPTQSHFVDVDGTQIHYLTWNAHENHKPGLLLAHGFRAHARWWSFIAPYLLDRFRVVALDFSGMGDSGSRARYTHECFVQDIVAVIDHAGFERVTLIGHSFGGSRVLGTCAAHPQRVERAIVIDSYIPIPEFPRRERLADLPTTKRIYPTYEAARARFKLVPEHNCSAPYVLDYVAQHSMKQVEGGWTWKFHEGYARMVDDPAAEAAHNAATIEQVSMPVSVIYGDQSIVMAKPLAEAFTRRLKQGRGPIEIPESHHHVLLDQPLSLVSALRAVLAEAASH